MYFLFVWTMGQDYKTEAFLAKKSIQTQVQFAKKQNKKPKPPKQTNVSINSPKSLKENV